MNHTDDYRDYITDDYRNKIHHKQHQREYQHEQKQHHEHLEQQNKLIMERDQGINKIVDGIDNINYIINNLAEIASEQAPLIENIEDNVESVGYHVETGIIKMVLGTKYLKSSWTKACWLLLIMLIIGAILTIILRYTI